MNKENRSQITSGLILITIGLLFLLNTFGYSFRISWHYLAHLWPLILVFIGLNLLLRRTPLWWIVPLLVILSIIGLFVIESGWYRPNPIGYYNFNLTNPRFYREYNQDSRIGRSSFRSSLELDDRLQRLEVVLKMGSGQLKLGSTRDTEKLYQADLRSGSGKPTLDYIYHQETGKGRLLIEDNPNRLNRAEQANDWCLKLTEKIPISMSIDSGAGKFSFDLPKLMVEELVLNLGAGKLEIDLGENTRYLELNSAATDIELYIPEQIAVEITTTGVISTNNFLAAGLSEINDQTFRSGNFGLLEEKTEIKISASASNIAVELY